jgi:2-polyprenyl-6-methoxyphenol hydroxylase-like FAD-dependent oxidoreductase
MASELLRRGVSVRLIEQNAGPLRASRAVAIQARTLEVFADMGVIYQVLDAGQRVNGASVFAGGKRIAHFDFDELQSPFPFAIDLPQADTERILTALLESHGGHVEHRTTLIGLNQNTDGIIAYLRHEDGATENFWADYVVGCDGARSTVRHVLGLPFEGHTRPENFVLADVKLDWALPADEWSLWFSEEGMAAVLPLPDGLCRVIGDHASGAPDFAEVLRLWEARVTRPEMPRDPVWISAFHVSFRQVPRYGAGRAFVAGDAAHVQSPAGGQGMNTGIQDAYNLAWKLALVMTGKSPASILETYTAEREPVGRGVLALTGQMTSVSMLREALPQHLRNQALALLAQFEVVQRRFMRRLGETAIDYRGSPLVSQCGRWWASDLAPGDRAPALDHALRTPRFKVLMFTGEEPSGEVLEQFASIDRYMATGYAGEVEAWLVSRGRVPWRGNKILDDTAGIHRAYGAGLPCVYVIRPDNYVGFRSLGAQPLPVLGYLAAVFDSDPIPLC